MLLWLVGCQTSFNKGIVAKWFLQKSITLNGWDNQTLIHQRLKMFLFPLVVSSIQFVGSMKLLPKAKRFCPPPLWFPALLWPITLHFSAALLKNTSKIKFVTVHYMGRHLVGRPSVRSLFCLREHLLAQNTVLKYNTKPAFVPSRTREVTVTEVNVSVLPHKHTQSDFPLQSQNLLLWSRLCWHCTGFWNTFKLLRLVDSTTLVCNC